jgi:hypothetical protein
MSTADHFAHRENDGVVVDLYWNRGLLEDEFRIEVVDERRGDRFVLYSPMLREAIDAYYDPLTAAQAALDVQAEGRPS